MSTAENVKLPRWLIALAVGTPLTIAIGYYYYSKKKYSDNEEKKLGEISKSTDKTTSNSVPETPLDRSMKLKTHGNNFFMKQKYEDAIKCYTEALSLCPPEETKSMSVIYQNRAACYECLNDLENVMKDTTSAIELNPVYVKALNRRYKAADKLGLYKQSVEDITTICFLEKFSDVQNIMVVDSILKKLGTAEAKELISKLEPIMASPQFIKCYFSSFDEDPVINGISKNELKTEGDTALFGLNAAKLAYLEGRYEDVILACNEQIARELSKSETSPVYYLSLLFRASFFILKGDFERALKDIGTIVEDRPDDVKITVNALIKRASVNLQCDQIEKCFEDFNLAVSLDPDNPDIYHHRGQIFLLTDEWEKAVEDFNKAYQWKKTDAINAQRLMTEYRYYSVNQMKEKAQEAIVNLKQIADKKNGSTEAPFLLGQIYLDLKDFDNAEKYYNIALEEDPKFATVIVYKAVLELQKKGDVNKAVELLQKAIETDPLLLYAHETFASVQVQMGNLKEAVELFNKAIKLAKSEKELAHLCALRAAAETQSVLASRPILASYLT